MFAAWGQTTPLRLPLGETGQGKSFAHLFVQNSSGSARFMPS
jgi:hypothetical protein